MASVLVENRRPQNQIHLPRGTWRPPTKRRSVGADTVDAALGPVGRLVGFGLPVWVRDLVLG